MPLHPEVATRLRPLLPYASWPELLADDRGPQLLASVFAGAAPVPPAGAIENTAVPGAAGAVPIRTYRADAPRAAMLWVHGGAFTTGDLDMLESDGVARALAARGVTAVTVDYRLAGPEVRFPAPLEDVLEVWRWLTSQADPLAISGLPTGIGGASAGGSLALAAALRTRDGAAPLPASVALAYPTVHFPNPALDPALDLAEVPRLLRTLAPDMERMIGDYVGRFTDVPPLAAPGHSRLQGLPPVQVAVAEYDDLRTSGELLVRQLQQADVPAALQLLEGMVHGYLNAPPTRSAGEADLTVDFLVRPLLEEHDR